MTEFETIAEAKAFIGEKVDVPIGERQEEIGDGITFHASTQELDNGQFTNIYDVSVQRQVLAASLHVPDQLTSIHDFAISNPDVCVATAGSFFFLADQYSASPRHLSLNLVLEQGQVRSLPVVDRETIIFDRRGLKVTEINANGMLSIDDVELGWAGSLTPHEADVQVYSNGNSVINHLPSSDTGSKRVLLESSRFTPAIEDDAVDIGLRRRKDGTFLGVEISETGGMDIFDHDFVVRSHRRNVANSDKRPIIKIHTVDTIVLDSTVKGALSVGPKLNEIDYDSHPINKDPSLGSKPPFVQRPLARSVVYQTDRGVTHFRLFDGRPGSEVFPGVTPTQAADSIRNEGDIVWGCFLDAGQSAKLSVRIGDRMASFGNTHYLKWATMPNERHLWTPHTSRPVANMIGVR